MTLFAQNGDGLRADQAGAPDNDNLHGLPRLSTIKAATLAKNLRGFPHRRKHRGGRLGSTELCNARGIRGSCGGNVSRASPARRRGHGGAGMGESCLGGLDVVPTETRRLVLISDHNGGVSRHSDLMIARAPLRRLGKVRQMSAIGTKRSVSRAGRGSAYWGSAEGCVRFVTIDARTMSGSTSNSLGASPHDRLGNRINPPILLLQQLHRSDRRRRD